MGKIKNISYRDKKEIKKILQSWRFIAFYFGRFARYFNEKEQKILARWVYINNPGMENPFSPNYEIGNKILADFAQEDSENNRIILNTIIQSMGTEEGIGVIKKCLERIGYNLEELLKFPAPQPNFEEIKSHWLSKKKADNFLTTIKSEAGVMLRTKSPTENEVKIFESFLDWLFKRKGYMFLRKVYI